jgi:hypothetical protein
MGVDGALKHTFHMDCPDHGILELGTRPLRPVRRRAWVTVPQVLAMRSKDDVKIIEKRADGKAALLEWTEYELQQEETMTNG